MLMVLTLSATIAFGLSSSHAHEGSAPSSTLETTCAVCAVVDAGDSLAADRTLDFACQDRVVAPLAVAHEPLRSDAPLGLAAPRGPPGHGDTSQRG